MSAAATARIEALARHDRWRQLAYHLPMLQRSIERGEEHCPLTPAMERAARVKSFERDPWRKSPQSMRVPAGSKIAVLCPGPSLRQSWGGTGYATVVAVNSAALRVPSVPWVVSWDRAPAEAFASRASVGVLSQRRILARIPTGGLAAMDEGIIPEPLKHSASQFSKLGGIVLAAWLGASQVDVYGDDMIGAGSNGVADVGRWGREKACGEIVAKYLRDVHGVTVARVLSVPR